MVRSSAVTLEDIACPENLLRALERSLRGTKRTPAVERICRMMSRELAELRRQIWSEQLQLGRATEFLIFDPKPRRVSAPIFVERVLHHAVMAHVGPVLERSLVADTFACLRGRGTLAAVLRAQQHSRRFSWYGQLDIRQYFASVQHGYDAAAGILAHADTREWRRRQLRLSPPDAECELY